MRSRRVLVFIVFALGVVLFAPSAGEAQINAQVSLAFPVRQSHVCGGKCTPFTAPIMTVFDHYMQVAYECSGGGYQTVTAFTGETANVLYPGFKEGSGKCKGLLDAYTNPDVTTFLDGYNYPGGGVLYYDGHPGIDFKFPFATPIFPMVNGCVTYLQGAEGIPLGSRGHVMAIIPSPTEPAGGCQSLVNPTNSTVIYMHLSSYYDPTTGAVMRCTSNDPKGTECNAGEDIVACPTCAQQYQWVSTSTTTPIGYTGNFASNVWGGVPAHLHVEIDVDVNGSPIAVDPYGWCGPQADPYIAFTGVTNVTLWNNFVLTCPGQ
jgi:hypothetical protein